jgi:ABC-2 type transport system permease protein
MRKILVIAQREYVAAVRSKGFLMGLFLLPVLMFGGIAGQAILKKQSDLSEKRFAVVDRTSGQWVWTVLDTAARVRNTTQRIDPETGKPTEAPFILERVAPSPSTPEAVGRQRLDLSKRVLHSEIFGFLEIGPEVDRPIVSLEKLSLQPLSSLPGDRYVVRYQSNRPTYLQFPHWAEQVVSAAVQLQRGRAAGLSLAQAGTVIQPVPLLTKGLSRLDPQTGGILDPPDESPLNAIIVPMSLTILMLMMLMVGTSPLMQSVIEEKMQRISEVLLGSVSPLALMTGKLIGIVGVSLTTVGIYLVGAYVGARQMGFTDRLTAPMIGWFLVFQVLGVVMYGSLFIAIGAACSDAKEAQTLLMPVMLLATAPVFALAHIVMNPTSRLATALSLFPFATPMLMTARLAIPPGIPVWQPILGMALTLLTTVACVYAAGRIFRVGLLMQGKGAQLRELWKWIFKG